MANTKWGSLNTTALWPASVAQIPVILEKIAALVNSTVSAAADVASHLDAVNAALNDPQITAIRQLVNQIKNALVELTGTGETGIHFLNVPLVPTLDDAGGNAGFYRVVRDSLSDPLDSARPMYDSKAYVTGLVVMVGSDQLAGIIDALQFLTKMTGALSAGMDANLLPHPQDVTVQLIPYSNTAKLAAHVMWAPAILASRPEYGIAAYRVRNAVIYRSASPIDRHMPQAKLTSLEIARKPYNPISLKYVDDSVEAGQTYYYAVGYELEIIDASGAHIIVPNATVSSSQRVTVVAPGSQSRVYVPAPRGTPPDWRALTGVFDLFPKVQLLLQLIANYINAIETSVLRAETSVARTATALKAVVAKRLALIARIIEILDEVKALILPVAGVYTFAFAGQGGNGYILSALYDALNNPADANRPPFDTGRELVAGLVLVAGAQAEPGIAAVSEVFTWLANGTSPAAAAAPSFTLPGDTPNTPGFFPSCPKSNVF